MAVTVLNNPAGLRLKFDLGKDELTNKTKVKSKTYSNLKYDANNQDVYDVAQALMGLQDLLVLPSSLLPTDGLDDTPLENGRRLFEYVGKQEELFRVLFQGHPSIYQSMLDQARQNAISLLHGIIDENDSPVPFRIMANHLTTSTIELMKLWLEDGKPCSSDVMGRYLVQMIFKPMRNLLSENR